MKQRARFTETRIGIRSELSKRRRRPWVMIEPVIIIQRSEGVLP